MSAFDDAVEASVRRVLQDESIVSKYDVLSFVVAELDAMPNEVSQRCRNGEVVGDAVRKVVADTQTTRLIADGLRRLYGRSPSDRGWLGASMTPEDVDELRDAAATRRAERTDSTSRVVQGEGLGFEAGQAQASEPFLPQGCGQRMRTEGQDYGWVCTEHRQGPNGETVHVASSGGGVVRAEWVGFRTGGRVR